MRAVVQRVTESSCIVDGTVIGEIGKGFTVLLGVEEGDSDSDKDYIIDKLINLRIFEDENEKMNLSIKDVDGSILLISQFTLLGDSRKGRRPSFFKAAKPEIANKIYEEMINRLREDLNVETGVFGADMKVHIVNDGPVTILLDSRKAF